jgi:hypothetical protein
MEKRIEIMERRGQSPEMEFVLVECNGYNEDNERIIQFSRTYFPFPVGTSDADVIEQVRSDHYHIYWEEFPNF